jgi:ribosomal-protein-alanine N-acetyltransferase
MALCIERAQLTDLDDLVRLEQLCFPTPWTRDSFRRELSRDDDVAVYLVARGEGEVVGYAGMWVMVDEAHVATIGVHPDQRRRGIGERLLVRLLSEAVRRGADRVFLEFRRSNRAAQELYAKYGFVEVGVRRSYYMDKSGNVEDAIVAEATGLQGPALREQVGRWERELAAEPADPA